MLDLTHFRTRFMGVVAPSLVAATLYFICTYTGYAQTHKTTMILLIIITTLLILLAVRTYFSDTCSLQSDNVWSFVSKFVFPAVTGGVFSWVMASPTMVGLHKSASAGAFEWSRRWAESTVVCLGVFSSIFVSQL